MSQFVPYAVAVNCAPTDNTTDLQTTNFQSILPLLDLLKGRDGRDGLPGRDGKNGESGPQGQQEPPGPQGPQGTRSAGITYIRWGKSSCPTTSGTQLVYAGRAGGTHYTTQEGGADKLCLPLDPDYISNPRSTSTSHVSPIYGAEYQTNNGQPA